MAPLFKSAFSLLCLSATVSAIPVQKSSSSPSISRRWECPAANETQKIWVPESYNIYPNQPDISRGPTPGFEVESFGGKSQLEHVAIFRGIPKEAKSCTLGWSQAERQDRVFLVDGESGLVKVRPLSGLPAKDEPVTYESVKQFDNPDEDKELSPDFTMWDDQDAAPHIAGGVDCAEELYFKMALADPATKSHVYLESDKQNGFWLEFSC